MSQQVIDNNLRLKSIGWPPALIKAINDDYAYLIKLKTGEKWSFSRAEYLSDTHVRIKPLLGGTDKIKFPRGIEISVADIVWIADAPTRSMLEGAENEVV